MGRLSSHERSIGVATRCTRAGCVALCTRSSCRAPHQLWDGRRVGGSTRKAIRARVLRYDLGGGWLGRTRGPLCAEAAQRQGCASKVWSSQRKRRRIAAEGAVLGGVEVKDERFGLVSCAELLSQGSAA